MAEHKVVLLPQDTTEIDVTTTQAGSHRGRATWMGHDAASCCTSCRPLRRKGHRWAPSGRRSSTAPRACRTPRPPRNNAAAQADAHRRKGKPALADPDSQQAVQVAQQLPGVCCVCIGDSEAGHLLSCSSRNQLGGDHPVHWLIRACQNRALLGKKAGRLRQGGDGHAHVLYEADLKIRGREAKTAAETRSRRPEPPDPGGQGGSAARGRCGVASAVATRTGNCRRSRSTSCWSVNRTRRRARCPWNGFW